MDKRKRPVARDINQRAFSFACRIISLYQFLTKQSCTGEIIGRQLLLSGTAIGANLEEAAGGQSRADFISKCNIALKKAGETLYWLRLLKESKVISSERISYLIKESDELVAIITTIVKNSRTVNKKSV